MYKWFQDYLTNRKQRVVIDNIESDWLPVTSGVPQGSILGPLLFLLYVNDMPSESDLCTTALFADDAKCFKEIRCTNDSIILQTHLDKLHEWSKRWHLCFNINKCKVLSVSRSIKVDYNYKIDSNPIERIGTFKDLGIIVDKTLSWSSHIQAIVNKSKKVCGAIKRTVGYNAPLNVKLQLYKSLCRPNLEFSSQVWSPHLKQDIKSLESIQRGMTKYIMGYNEMTYDERCKRLQVLPLSYRREVLDLVFLYNCLHGAIDVDFTDEITYVNSCRNLRSTSHGLNLQTKLVKTETYKSSYFSRVVTLWNKIPLEVKTVLMLMFLNMQ